MEIASGNAQGAGFREKENLLLVEASTSITPVTLMRIRLSM